MHSGWKQNYSCPFFRIMTQSFQNDVKHFGPEKP
jgi:hypothetical protein